MKYHLARVGLLLIFIFIAFLLLTSVYGCATPRDPLGIFAMLDQELEKEAVSSTREKGWVVQDEEGYLWEWWATQGGATIILARCEYSYMKVQGIEYWTGKYYNQSTSFWGFGMRNRPHYATDLEGLSGCVSWVENFMYGDYYI